MGVLNTTPDSFSDGGSWLDPDAALRQALDMIDAGADIIDIGGESTRPGAESVPAEIEIDRVVSGDHKASELSTNPNFNRYQQARSYA